MIRYLIELIGTFVFLSVVIITKNPFIIGLTLTSVILVGKNFGDIYFNPAVTYLMYINKEITFKNLLEQLLIQFIAVISTFYFYKYLHL